MVFSTLASDFFATLADSLSVVTCDDRSTLGHRLFLLHVEHVGYMGKRMVGYLFSICRHPYRPIDGLEPYPL